MSEDTDARYFVAAAGLTPEEIAELGLRAEVDALVAETFPEPVLTSVEEYKASLAALEDVIAFPNPDPEPEPEPEPAPIRVADILEELDALDDGSDFDMKAVEPEPDQLDEPETDAAFDIVAEAPEKVIRMVKQVVRDDEGRIQYIVDVPAEDEG